MQFNMFFLQSNANEICTQIIGIPFGAFHIPIQEYFVRSLIFSSFSGGQKLHVCMLIDPCQKFYVIGLNNFLY